MRTLTQPTPAAPQVPGIVDLMPATPLRDLPDDVMAHYTQRARREGVSRNSLLVRVLTQHARAERRAPLTAADLRASASRVQDLDRSEVMDSAWS